VLVVGSVNRDYLCTVPRLPAPGETVLAAGLVVGTGGKGANQAVAAARLGARTAFVGCVGDDADGRAVVSDLVAAGVDTGSVRTVPDDRSGTAFVVVGEDGENSIVVAAGANGRLGPAEAAAAVTTRVRPGDVVVAQAEVPVSAVQAVAHAAVAAGGRFVLNLAPYVPVPDTLLALCDPLVVNEGEAAELVGSPVRDLAEANSAVSALRQRTRSAVVTLGADGAVVAAPDLVEHVPAEPVEVRDTTGAGDAFIGALAARLAAGEDLLAAVRAGVVAGTRAVGRTGAQTSCPEAEDLLPTLSRGVH